MSKESDRLFDDSEQALLNDHLLRFRPQTFFRLYRKQILIHSCMLVLYAILAVTFLVGARCDARCGGIPHNGVDLMTREKIPNSLVLISEVF